MSVFTCISAFLVLQIGLAKCFSWDIVVSGEKRLQFYNNGNLTHIEDIPSANLIYSITYDPVHYRFLFADNRYSKHQISSFDLSTRNIQPLVTGKSSSYLRVGYDPVTQLLFWAESSSSIYSYSLKPASSNKAVDGNLIVTLVPPCYDIAVDSCGGYIYWITNYKIERARLDGSDREVLIDSSFTGYSLTIDQQTQKIYWTEVKRTDTSIESADFNGMNRRTLYIIRNENFVGSLIESNDFIYWNSYHQKAIWQLSKNNLEAKLFATTNYPFMDLQYIAANYTIKDQLKRNQNCETLKSLIPKEAEPDVILCVHGTKVSGESRCECTQGYTGERCDVNICQNYCFQGNCSVSAKEQPKCSCKAGYSGQRCEVNACHGYCLNGGVCSLNEEDSPVCQCTIDYEGERCGVPICKDYCFQGNCNVSAEGQPICSCTGGYSGERCEFNACHDYCFNNGVCFLNEEEETVCQCTTDYEGERCDIAIKHTGFCGENMTQQILQDLRSEVKQVQVIKNELQSEVNQVHVIKEDLQRTLQFYSAKNDENEAKIQKCEKSIMDLDNHNVRLENHDEITSKALTSNTLSETS